MLLNRAEMKQRVCPENVLWVTRSQLPLPYAKPRHVGVNKLLARLTVDFASPMARK